MTINIANIAALPTAAMQFAAAMGSHRIFAFYGGMGAGKTTFIKALCTYLGVHGDVVNSPTFSIINEYRTDSDDVIYHFDFYRIRKPEEAIDIGLFDYLNSGALCLMEWPEQIEPLLPDDCVIVHINVLPDGTRTLTMDMD